MYLLDFFPKKKWKKWKSELLWISLYFNYSRLQFPGFLRLKLRVLSYFCESDVFMSAMICGAWFVTEKKIKGKIKSKKDNTVWADKEPHAWHFSRDNVTNDESLSEKSTVVTFEKLERKRLPTRRERYIRIERTEWWNTSFVSVNPKYSRYSTRRTSGAVAKP